MSKHFSVSLVACASIDYYFYIALLENQVSCKVNAQRKYVSVRYVLVDIILYK